MDKEQLKTKIEALKANEEIASNALNEARTQRLKAEQELTNAGKPVVSESLMSDIVEHLADVVRDACADADIKDMEYELGISGNEIYIDHINLYGVSPSDFDIQTALEEFLAVEEDKNCDNS